MSVRNDLLMEFEQELATTRRVLERVPEGKLAWKPHEKARSLGQLAIHIATVPGAIARITGPDSFDVLTGDFNPPTPADTSEIAAALDQSAYGVETALKTTTDEAAAAPWTLMRGDTVLFTIPRVAAWRSLMLNHWYHHRGQLCVYLRLLDVPIPSVYGPSADENPFG